MFSSPARFTTPEILRAFSAAVAVLLGMSCVEVNLGGILLILLISSDKTLAETVTGMLPAKAPFISVPSISQAQAIINEATARQPVTIILFDARTPSKLPIYHNQWRHIPKDIPFIAIISDPAQRQAALKAGADDYLLTPLLHDEVNTRLAAHLHSAIRGLNSLLEMAHQMGKGVSSTHILSRGIENLAEIFHAPSAWLLLFDRETETIDLAGGYNLPPLFQSGDISGQEAVACTKVLLKDGAANTPRLVECPYLVQAEYKQANGLTHHLSIPLHSGQRMVGVLNLAYPGKPQITRAERRTLTLLGQDIGIILEMVHWQEEIQAHATQTAFMVLLARSINKNLDLNNILSLTLEQIVSLLGASDGEIWLLSDEEEYLQQASSLSSSFVQNPNYMSGSSTRQIKKDQGLIGWVFTSSYPLCTDAPTASPYFDAEIDCTGQRAACALLAVPLIHHQKTIGVLAFYKPPGNMFDNRDMVLMEGIAALVSTAIANARLMQELRVHADQQQILYDMSRQIAADLDLPTTLQRVLQWCMRLFDSEIGLLWLAQEPNQSNSASTSGTLQLAAALGIDLPVDGPIVISLEQSLNGWVAQNEQPVVVNDPAADSRFNMSVSQKLNIVPRNIISAPMFYNGQIIGTISLFNKTSGSFTNVELTLLSTVVEMVAIAVGNARLHDQTVTLMEEREQLHKQIIQAERLATVGRLTASLSHEINNPMQSIRGALTLAQEELHDPAEVMTYLQMSLEESERVIRLVDRMQQIYRPKNGKREVSDLNGLLQEAVGLAYKELRRQNIIIHTNLTPDLPEPKVRADQLHLVFLSLVLNLGSAIDVAGGGELYVRSYATPQAVGVEFSTKDPQSRLARWLFVSEESAAERTGDLSFGLFLSHDIIASHGGRIEFDRQDQNFVCSVELPLDESNAGLERRAQF